MEMEFVIYSWYMLIQQHFATERTKGEEGSHCFHASFRRSTQKFQEMSNVTTVT